MAQRFAWQSQNLTVVANQTCTLGVDLIADIRQQGVSKVIFKTSAINGGVQA
ncbi:hypothetical protein KLVAMA180M_21800 [Klebsiella variicola subsp. variicola]